MSEWRKVFMGGEEVEFDHLKKGDKFQLHLEDGEFQFYRADSDAFPIDYGKPGNAVVKCSMLAFGSDDEISEVYAVWTPRKLKQSGVVRVQQVSFCLSARRKLNFIF